MVAGLLRGEYKDSVTRYAIIDCRYLFEYQGGHIRNAMHMCDPKEIEKTFFWWKEGDGSSTCHESIGPPSLQSESSIDDYDRESLASPRGGGDSPASAPTASTPPLDPRCCSDLMEKINPGDSDLSSWVFIFHCEFSQQRGPFMANTLRKLDRRLTTPYPLLTFPEVYIMQGGYKAFFAEYPELCDPRSYTPMRAKIHKAQLRKDIAQLRRSKSETLSTEHIRRNQVIVESMLEHQLLPTSPTGHSNGDPART